MSSTLLCVDDDRNLCGILENALAGEGYRVLSAHDGEQGLRLIAEESPELLIVDPSLPKLDGFTMLERLRNLEASVSGAPVLLLCGGRLTDDAKRRAKQLGVAAVLNKPVPLEMLVRHVAANLKDASPSGAAADADEDLDPVLSGKLRDLSFPHLLHHLHGLRATGVLLLATGKKRKAIQVRDGYPVAVKSNMVNECLGNLLVRLGLLTDAQLQESIDRMQRGGGLQGEILVAMHVLSEEEISGALRRQAAEKLYEIFTWSDGRFKFEIGERLKRANALALSDNPASIIVAGVRRRFRLEAVDRFLREHGAQYVVPGGTDFFRNQAIDLTPGEYEFLSGLDGTRQLKGLTSAPEAVRRLLYALIVTEMLELRDQPVPQPKRRVAAEPAADDGGGGERDVRAELAARAEKLRGLNYFQMLELKQDANAGAVASAFERIAPRFHPDVYRQASQAVRQLADEVYKLLQEASETLQDPRRRREYELELKKGERREAERRAGEQALEAEIAFQKGEAKLKARDYEGALASFGEALQRFPDEGVYHAHYGWALYLCHPEEGNMIREAVEHVKRGAQLARDHEKPYLFLGRLYKVVGREAAAEKMFTRCVQIQPDCVEAMRELRLINMRREKGKGLIGRLLRR
ncbi:MAG: response regulator [Proteobacteria bacterium]|nr:response regulator [Pseudomonadota bacterium]